MALEILWVILSLSSLVFFLTLHALTLLHFLSISLSYSLFISMALRVLLVVSDFRFFSIFIIFSFKLTFCPTIFVLHRWTVLGWSHVIGSWTERVYASVYKFRCVVDLAEYNTNKSSHNTIFYTESPGYEEAHGKKGEETKKATKLWRECNNLNVKWPEYHLSRNHDNDRIQYNFVFASSKLSNSPSNSPIKIRITHTYSLS